MGTRFLACGLLLIFLDMGPKCGQPEQVRGPVDPPVHENEHDGGCHDGVDNDANDRADCDGAKGLGPDPACCVLEKKDPESKDPKCVILTETWGFCPDHSPTNPPAACDEQAKLLECDLL